MSEVKTKQVIAIRTGLKGGRIILEGERFEVGVSENAKWYRDVDGSTKKTADTNNDGVLSKAEILKWFEDNNLEIDASLGVAKLREAHAIALNSINDPE